MSNVIGFKVFKNTLKRDSGYAPVSGENGYSVIRCVFPSGGDWENVTAVSAGFFVHPKDIASVTADITDDGEERTAVFAIPGALLKQGERLHFGLFATVGGVTIATNTVALDVARGIISEDIDYDPEEAASMFEQFSNALNTALLGKANKAAAGSAGELAALDSNGSPIRSNVSVAQSIGEGSNSKVPTTAAVKTALDGKADKAAAGTAGELAALDANGAPIRSGVSVAQIVGDGSTDEVPTTDAVRKALDEAEDTTNENIDWIFQGNSAYFPQLYFEQYFSASGSNYKLIYEDRNGDRNVLFDFGLLPAAKGEKGDKGEQGPSAYDVAVGNGFVGTVKQWIDSLKGATGAQGDKGDKGDAGRGVTSFSLTNGVLSANFDDRTSQTIGNVKGEKGDKGDKGDTGAQGEKGDKGDKGDTGAQGETGATGAQGDKGDKGDAGRGVTSFSLTNGVLTANFDDRTSQTIGNVKGDKGEKGEKGDTGAKGDKGDKGDTGAQGEKGDKGDTGATGAQGDKGDKGDDYILTEQDKTKIAALVNPYVFADEIPPDADHTKKYVLPDGYIYEWREGTPDVPYNANTKIINKRPSTGAHYETALLDYAGVLVSDLIPFDASWKYRTDATSGSLANINISGIDKLVPGYNNNAVIIYYYRRDNGNSLGAALAKDLVSLNKPAAGSDIALPVQFSLMDESVFFTGMDTSNPGATIGYVRVMVGISTGSNITEDDVKDVVINVPFYDTPGTEAGWVSTGEKHPDYIADSIFDVNTNQTLYVVGDSIAYGYGGSGGAKVDSWVKHAIEHNGYNANSMNLSESGLGFCTTSTKSHTINDIVGGTDFSGADVVVVALGINDWKSSATLAQLWTGMQYCFNKIRTDNPYCKIYYLLPFNVSFSGAYATFYGLGFKGDSDAAKCYGNTLREFINLIKAKCSEPDFKAYDVRLIDMVECAAINRNNITTALFDNLHPSAATQEALGREIARYIAQDCVSRDKGNYLTLDTLPVYDGGVQ